MRRRGQSGADRDSHADPGLYRRRADDFRLRCGAVLHPDGAGNRRAQRPPVDRPRYTEARPLAARRLPERPRSRRSDRGSSPGPTGSTTTTTPSATPTRSCTGSSSPADDGAARPSCRAAPHRSGRSTSPTTTSAWTCWRRCRSSHPRSAASWSPGTSMTGPSPRSPPSWGVRRGGCGSMPNEPCGVSAAR